MKKYFTKSSSSLKITLLIALIAISLPMNFSYVMHSMKRLNISTATVNNFGYIRGSIQRISKLDKSVNQQIIIDEIDAKFLWIKKSYIDAIDFNAKEKSALSAKFSFAYSCWKEFQKLLYTNNDLAILKQSEVCWSVSNKLTNYVQKIEEKNQKDFRKNLQIRMGFVLSLALVLFLVVWFNIRGELERSVITDGLTGLYNRYYFMKQIEHYLSIASRYKENLAIIFIDIDFFKQVNDTFGHQVGDYVLKEVTQLIQNELRDGDSAYRYGGEEFVVIATHTTAKEAEILANRFREIIALHSFEKAHKVTISLGISQFKEADDSFSLIKRADDALYLAKNSGRNCVKTV